MNKSLYFLRRTIDWSCGIMLGSILIILLLGIFFRYVLNQALYWSDMVSVNLFTWMGFLGGVIAIRRRSMFRVDLLLNYFGTSCRIWWLRIILLIELLVLAVVAYYGILLTRVQWTLILMAFPQWYPTVNFGWVYLTIPVSAILMMVEVGILLFMGGCQEDEK